MTEPSVRKPTKKAYHFPKGADQTVADTVTEKTKASSKVATKKAVATRKAAVTKKAGKQKVVAAVETPVAVEVKAKRTKKEKVVRDSFTMPKPDYDKLAVLKQKCLDAGVPVKKSELLRAGVLLLAAASSEQLLAAVAAVETVKTGRPARS